LGDETSIWFNDEQKACTWDVERYPRGKVDESEQPRSLHQITWDKVKKLEVVCKSKTMTKINHLVGNEFTDLTISVRKGEDKFFDLMFINTLPLTLTKFTLREISSLNCGGERILDLRRLTNLEEVVIDFDAIVFLPPSIEVFKSISGFRPLSTAHGSDFSNLKKIICDDIDSAALCKTFNPIDIHCGKGYSTKTDQNVLAFDFTISKKFCKRAIKRWEGRVEVNYRRSTSPQLFPYIKRISSPVFDNFDSFKNLIDVACVECKSLPDSVEIVYCDKYESASPKKLKSITALSIKVEGIHEHVESISTDYDSYTEESLRGLISSFPNAKITFCSKKEIRSILYNCGLLRYYD